MARRRHLSVLSPAARRHRRRATEKRTASRKGEVLVSENSADSTLRTFVCLVICRKEGKKNFRCDGCRSMIRMIGHNCCHTIRKDHYIKYICTYWRHFISTDKSAASCSNALSCPEKQLVGKIVLWSLHIHIWYVVWHGCFHAFAGMFSFMMSHFFGGRLQQKLEPWAGNRMKVRWVAKYFRRVLQNHLIRVALCNNWHKVGQTWVVSEIFEAGPIL